MNIPMRRYSSEARDVVMGVGEAAQARLAAAAEGGGPSGSGSEESEGEGDRVVEQRWTEHDIADAFALFDANGDGCAMRVCISRAAPFDVCKPACVT